MDPEILNSYSKLNHLNVSRETFLDFENYITMILDKNKKINIISQNTASKRAIIDRHIIDSAQIIDFVDLNSNTTTDLGSGSGMPGIIVAIILKNMNNNMNVHLYEKSYHKRQFLKEVSEKLNLKTKIFFPFLPIKKIKFLNLEKFSYTKSKTTGIGLNARDIIVPVSKFLISYIFFLKTFVFKFNFSETSVKKLLLW